MTDDQIWTQCTQFVATACPGVNVIRAYESGPRPSLPYIMVNFTGSRNVRENEMEMEYEDRDEDAEQPDSNGEFPKINVAPVIEKEWSYSVHAFGAVPSDVLRPIESARRVSQIMEGMRPLTVFDTSMIRSVPEWVNNDWEPRANMDIFLRGLTRDGFVIDTIDDIEPFTATREGTA